jgi:hypothetical protein
MFRISLVIVLMVHGLIHLIGLVHGYQWFQIPMLTRPMTRSTGLLWGLVTVLMVTSAVLLLIRHDRWWMVAGVAALISQMLIINYWHDARFGTMANAIIVLAVICGGASWQFHQRYVDAVHHALERTHLSAAAVIVDDDLKLLPAPVQRYLRSTGVVGTRRPRNMRMTLSGEIRNEGGPWMPFTTEQFNTFDVPTRFFWMDATMKSLPTKGFHSYNDGVASMQIKLLGLLSVADVVGPQLDTAETVTWFNDLCLFAPGALLDSRITWTPVDDHSASATFVLRETSISAVLVFDQHDRIINFISDDRYLVAPPKPPVRRQFSTPASEHRWINGRLLPGHGDAVWQMPSESTAELHSFVYGRFTLTSIAYDL